MLLIHCIFSHTAVPPIVDISNIVPGVKRRQNESVVIECPAQGIPDPDVSFLKVCSQNGHNQHQA